MAGERWWQLATSTAAPAADREFTAIVHNPSNGRFDTSTGRDPTLAEGLALRMCRFFSEPAERDGCAVVETCPSSRYAIAVGRDVNLEQTYAISCGGASHDDAIAAALASCAAHGLRCEEYRGAPHP